MKEIETKTLHQNVTTLDDLYKRGGITLGECLQIQMQLKILSSLEKLEDLLKEEMQNG